MPFLYSNHVVKAHLGRITEDTPEHQGVVVFIMNDTPLGFGVTACSTIETRKLDPTAIIVFHQADVEEYLRDEVGGFQFFLSLTSPSFCRKIYSEEGVLQNVRVVLFYRWLQCRCHQPLRLVLCGLTYGTKV